MDTIRDITGAQPLTRMHTLSMETTHDCEIHETYPYSQKGVKVQTKCWGVMSPPYKATTRMNLSRKASASERSRTEFLSIFGL
jgi:hypothetical protein